MKLMELEQKLVLLAQPELVLLAQPEPSLVEQLEQLEQLVEQSYIEQHTDTLPLVLVVVVCFSATVLDFVQHILPSRQSPSHHKEHNASSAS